MDETPPLAPCYPEVTSDEDAVLISGGAGLAVNPGEKRESGRCGPERGTGPPPVGPGVTLRYVARAPSRRAFAAAFATKAPRSSRRKGLVTNWKAPMYSASRVASMEP